MVATVNASPLGSVAPAFSPLFIGAMVATYNCIEELPTSVLFQSPFHRGNGCYSLYFEHIKPYSVCFQSPFHRGNGCYYKMSRRRWATTWRLSVPFSSGQWLLLQTVLRACANCLTFSPLFIGAMVATNRHFRRRLRRNRILSVRFSSRQWLLLTDESKWCQEHFFQSPFHRGNGCYWGSLKESLLLIRLSVPFSSGQWLLHSRVSTETSRSVPFSPLFIGAMVATTAGRGDR